MAQKLLKFTKAGKMAKSGHTRQRIKNSELDERLGFLLFVPSFVVSYHFKD